MAIFWDAPVAPDAQTFFMRELPYPTNLGLLNLFGQQTHDTDTIEMSEIQRTNRTARYRAWDARVHKSTRDVGSEAKIRFIPLSSSLDMGEYERLQYQYSTMGVSGGNEQRLARAIYNDSTQLTREVQNRLELAWGDALSDGILTISEGGLTGSAGVLDFGVPAGQKTTVGTSWATVATAPALTDIRTVVDTYSDNNGFKPGWMVTSTAQRRNLRANKQIIDAIYGSTGGRTQVTEAELNTLLASEYDGLTLLPAYDSNVDVDGVTTRTLAADKVLFLPPNLDDLGHTAFGTTVTALELVNSGKTEMSFEEAPGIVGIVNKGDGIPFRQEVQVDALAMPVITGPKLLSILDVVP
jgi:hypothetical protein